MRKRRKTKQQLRSDAQMTYTETANRQTLCHRSSKFDAVSPFAFRLSSAFTLVELLVVLSVVAVLAALAYPAYQRVIESGRATACVSNLRQIGLGLGLYLGESNNMMPVLQTGRQSTSEDVPVIDNTLDRYVQDRRVFACPADKGGFAQRTGTSYFWNVALNGQPLGNLNFLQLVSDHSHIPIVADKEGFHPYLDDKVNILYADGHATKDVKFFTGK